jgi:hypothetical protein
MGTLSQSARVVPAPIADTTSDFIDVYDVRVDYPYGFARRFLDQAARYGHAWANVDLDVGEIDYVEDPSDTTDDDVNTASARISVTDTDLQPAWDRLVREALAFYPSLRIEEGAATILSVCIEEFPLTNNEPAPRFFTVSQILH